MDFIKQEEGTEHTIERQHTAIKDDETGSNKAVSPGHDGFTVLPVELEINGMGEQLEAVTGNGGEGPNQDPIGGVNVVVFVMAA